MRLGHYNLTTGEVLEHVNVIAVRAKRRNGFGKDWLAVAQDKSFDLAEMRSELGEAGYAALWYVIGSADFENRVSFTKKEAATKLKMQASGFSRAFKRLIDAGLIRETERVGGNPIYLLSPEVCWRGSARNHHAALAAWRKGE